MTPAQQAFRGRSLQARLAAAMFLPMLLAALAVAVAWTGLDHARTRLDDTQARVAPALKTIYGARQALQQAAELQAHWLVAGTRDERNILAAQWSAQGKWLQQRVQQHAALDADDAQLAQRFSQSVTQLLAAQSRAMREDDTMDASELAVGEARRALVSALVQADEWQQHADQWGEQQASSTSQQLSARDVATAVLLMAALALGLIQWQRLTHEIEEPLRQSAEALAALAAGRLDFALPMTALPETAQIAERIDALREIVTFAFESDDEAEDLARADRDRLALTQSAVARYRVGTQCLELAEAQAGVSSSTSGKEPVALAA